MNKMRTIVVWVGLAVGLAASSASAQVTGAGYAFGAPGQARASGHSETTFHFGGGGEVQTPGGLGGGAEIGFLGPTASFGDGIGVFNANGSYHIRGRTSSRTVPFITGGYSLLFRHGHSNGWNVGDGVEHWVRPGLGLRLEFRDQVHSDGGVTAHFLNFRAGISFR